ncbi:hypothetical protein Leryth_022488 [Lithospermum erythrorhizon]|nr:hypothetical protein Leryth_022488 [Lithospermum erythrorhizon]
MSIEDYYNKLVGLFDELIRLKPLHNCTCGHCTSILLFGHEIATCYKIHCYPEWWVERNRRGTGPRQGAASRGAQPTSNSSSRFVAPSMRSSISTTQSTVGVVQPREVEGSKQELLVLQLHK